MRADSIRVEQRDLLGAVVLEPHGVLDAASYGELRGVLVKAGIEEPRAVIVDLDDLVVPDGSALALFTSVSGQLAQWPGVPMLLTTGHDADRARVVQLRLARFVSVHSSVAAAAAAIDDPPPRRIARRKLPNSLASAALARRFVLDVCSAWHASAHTAEAVVIANELVENTLLHTYSAPSIRLELRRGLLSVAVYDDDPHRATLVETTMPVHRRGLVLVAQLAYVWGCSPTPHGGKVVWAVLRT